MPQGEKRKLLARDNRFELASSIMDLRSSFCYILTWARRARSDHLEVLVVKPDWKSHITMQSEGVSEWIEITASILPFNLSMYPTTRFFTFADAESPHTWSSMEETDCVMFQSSLMMDSPVPIDESEPYFQPAQSDQLCLDQDWTLRWQVV